MLYYTDKEEKTYNKFNISNKHAIKVLALDKKVDNLATLGSLIGVAAAFCACVALNNKNKLKKDIFVKNNLKKSAKNLLEYTKIDYEGFKGWCYMTSQAGMGAFCSMAFANLKDKDKENRAEKLKEAIFVLNNVMIPTAFAKTTEYLITNSKLTKNNVINNIGKNKVLKNLAVLSSLFLGLFTSLKVTNELNTKLIEPDDKKIRKIKPTDMLVHIDDIIPVLITSKGSILQKLPLDYLMPVIYFVLGSQAGKKNCYEKNE